jgi:hypothetical protein
MCTKESRVQKHHLAWQQIGMHTSSTQPPEFKDGSQMMQSESSRYLVHSSIIGDMPGQIVCDFAECDPGECGGIRPQRRPTGPELDKICGYFVSIGHMAGHGAICDHVIGHVFGSACNSPVGIVCEQAYVLRVYTRCTCFQITWISKKMKSLRK